MMRKDVDNVPHTPVVPMCSSMLSVARGGIASSGRQFNFTVMRSFQALQSIEPALLEKKRHIIAWLNVVSVECCLIFGFDPATFQRGNCPVWLNHKFQIESSSKWFSELNQTANEICNHSF